MRVVLRRWKSHARYAVRKSGISVFLFFSVIIVILIFMIHSFEKHIVPAVITMAEDQAETAVVVMVDEVIAECDELNNLVYDDIIEVSRHENGEIATVSARTVMLNRIRSRLSVGMNKKLDSFNETHINVPLGGLLGFKFLSGAGIKIPVSFTPYGTAYADFKSSVEENSINRTYHKIYIEASATITIFAPLFNETLTVKTKVPIAETVISGDVPDSYFDIDGLVNNEGQN